jgi:hypothetical protein
MAEKISFIVVAVFKSTSTWHSGLGAFFSLKKRGNRGNRENRSYKSYRSYRTDRTLKSDVATACHLLLFGASCKRDIKDLRDSKD